MASTGRWTLAILHTASHSAYASQQDGDIYAMINAYWEPLNFAIQEGVAKEWQRVVDTSRLSPFDLLEVGSEETLASLHYKVEARSVVVLLRTL